MTTDVRKGVGFGYKTRNGKICMVRCFKCGAENHSMVVSTGKCAWCGHDANKKKAKKA